MSLTWDEAFFLAGERERESRGTGKGRELTFPPSPTKQTGKTHNLYLQSYTFYNLQ